MDPMFPDCLAFRDPKCHRPTSRCPRILKVVRTEPIISLMNPTSRTRRLLAATTIASGLLFAVTGTPHLGAIPVNIVGGPEASTPTEARPMVAVNVPAKPDVPPALRLGPNQPVGLHLSSDQRLLGTGTTDANGALAVEFPLPADLATGTYTIEVKGASAAGTPIAVSHQIDVTATVSDVSDVTSLPADSADSPSSLSTLLAALSLAFVAANLVLIQRLLKRRNRETTIELGPDIRLT